MTDGMTTANAARPNGLLPERRNHGICEFVFEKLKKEMAEQCVRFSDPRRAVESGRNSRTVLLRREIAGLFFLSLVVT
jgi:hypothetical protein